MNIVISTFTSPFSFFCISEQDGKDIDFLENCVNPRNVKSSTKYQVSDVSHGQYVAVMWKNKWARGLVHMESQFLIWLIDYGIYLKPDDKAIYIDLPPTFKKLPTKVFEASIHGVVPLNKELTYELGFKDVLTTTWNPGSIEKAQSLIASASKIYFVPTALLTTKDNDVVIGDLFLVMNQRKIVNIIDELKIWPVFLESNKAAYLENLRALYTNRRKHRACLLKPAIVDELPTITLDTTLEKYYAICAAAPQFEASLECSDVSEEGSTVLNYGVKKNQDVYKLSAAEVEQYSNLFITIGGRKYNALNILVNKIKDLNMCERYKNHDRKSVGRASYRTPPISKRHFFLYE